MFCGKCGTKNADNVEFCTNCGAKLNNKSTVTKSATVSVANQNDKNRKVGIIAVAVAAVIVVILGVLLLGGRSYKATIEKFVDAQFDANAEAIIDLMPQKMMEYALEQEGYDPDDFNYLIDELNEELQDQLDSLDSYLGEGWKITYKILDDEDVKGADLDNIKNAYEDAGVKVSAAKSVEVELTVTSDETESSNSLDVSLIKVGRSWYLDAMSMGNLI